MPKTIMDYLQNLPPTMQFVLLLLSILGTSGFISGAVAVWKLYAKSDSDRDLLAAQTEHEKELIELKMRIEPLELERLRAQNEARQAEAMNENMRNLIQVIANGNERWQKVYDVKSERQLEADKLQHETNKLFADAMKDNAGAIRTLTEMIEIQSEHYQVFKESVVGMESNLKTTLQTVEVLARDNRTDLTTALGLSVTSRTESENTLRTIKETIHGVVKEITSIMELDKRERAADLSSIKTKLQAIETALTPQAPTQPLPDTVTTGNTAASDDPQTDNEDTLKSA